MVQKKGESTPRTIKLENLCGNGGLKEPYMGVGVCVYQNRDVKQRVPSKTRTRGREIVLMPNRKQRTFWSYMRLNFLESCLVVLAMITINPDPQKTHLVAFDPKKNGTKPEKRNRSFGGPGSQTTNSGDTEQRLELAE